MRIDALLIPKAVREARCLLRRRELGFVMQSSVKLHDNGPEACGE